MNVKIDLDRSTLACICDEQSLKQLNKKRVPGIVSETLIATNDVFQQTNRSLPDQLSNHSIENTWNVRESIIGLTYVLQTRVVLKQLLHYESSHLGEGKQHKYNCTWQYTRWMSGQRKTKVHNLRLKKDLINHANGEDLRLLWDCKSGKKQYILHSDGWLSPLPLRLAYSKAKSTSASNQKPLIKFRNIGEIIFEFSEFSMRKKKDQFDPVK